MGHWFFEFLVLRSWFLRHPAVEEREHRTRTGAVVGVRSWAFDVDCSMFVLLRRPRTAGTAVPTLRSVENRRLTNHEVRIMKKRIGKQNNEGLNFDILRFMIRQSAVPLNTAAVPAEPRNRCGTPSGCVDFLGGISFPGVKPPAMELHPFRVPHPNGVPFHRVFRVPHPNGVPFHSPGQRPGIASPSIFSRTLKGCNSFDPAVRGRADSTTNNQ